MDEQIRLELFTVGQVRHWLETGHGERGLSEKLISRTRAWAIVNNPYSTDELNIVSAIFVNDKVAAYTYLFPDENNGRRIYWNTTLYCAPEYEGRGYAAIVMGQFCELYGEDYFDLDAAKESIANLEFLGLQVDYIDQYVLSNKTIRTTDIRGKLAAMAERIRSICRSRRHQLHSLLSNADYRLEYIRFIDDETYSFIKEHSEKDLFLRSQDMLNWILTYPFMQESPLLHRVDYDNRFSSTRRSFRFHAVRVMDERKQVGFYIMNESQEVLYINYLYYDKEYAETVYLSIAEHVVLFRTPKVFTSDKGCADYIHQFGLYPKYSFFHKSFSHPKSFVYDSTQYIQAGDGDNIT